MRATMLRQVSSRLQFLRGQLQRPLPVCRSGFSSSAALRSSGDGPSKVYELRTYHVKPALFWEFMEILEEKVHLRMDMSKMVGFWRVDMGGLNQVVHLWEYDDFAHRTAVAKTRSAHTGWMSTLNKLLPTVEHQDNALLLPLPWSQLKYPDTPGGWYELRSYRLTPGAHLQEPFRKTIQARAAFKYAELLGVWSSEFGELNRVYMLWHHKDLDQRMLGRAKAAQDPAIVAASRESAPSLVHQWSKILLPSSFSPMQ
ncbi:NIPSNAP3B [Branchiostoma lanceolatum]|uniref:NIPSNAP3B protein n=1 Tax=Branchiostoma lanceolatum TaxID=7740 RepID=A0A8K0A8U3_BRALA|nr:NIPSNAP3B [Branchiostoma lanceolatum]